MHPTVVPAQIATSLVTCGGYQSCFDAETLSSMNNCLNGGTHGPVHIAVGGEWDNPAQLFITKTGITTRVFVLPPGTCLGS